MSGRNKDVAGSGDVHVLVVDDEPQIRELVVDALEPLGYNCVAAGEGEEALNLVETFAFDLVITDLKMPGMGGIELIRNLRGMRPALPVIIMSGYADFESAREALRLGVADYLSKPFEELAELQAAARRALETSTQRASTDMLIAEMDRRAGRDAGGSVRNDGSIGTGSVIAGYEIVGTIGSGGMGSVYKAKHPVSGDIVALKVLSRIYADDEAYVRRFLNEARVASRLDHPNIVRGLDSGRYGDTCYFAMEYVNGRSVGEMLKAEGTMPEKQALEIALQVARALEHIWAIRHVHRDIKPDNILLTEDGAAKITDLGLVKEADPDASGLTETGFTVGTARYISPEQAKAVKDLDVRADIYSLGATLYSMVTGAPPFSGDSQMEVVSKHLTERHVSARTYNPDVSDYTSRVIDKMLQKFRGDRYQTPALLIEDLELVLAGEPPVNLADRSDT